MATRLGRSGACTLTERRYDFDCASLRLAAPLNVLYLQLHMHQSGIAMETVQYDKDGVYKATHRYDYYDFNRQDAVSSTMYNYVTGAPSITIEPGDHMHTTCWYNNDGRAGAVASHRFGLASNDEMCITFIGYYPRVPLGFGRYCGGVLGATDAFQGVQTKPATMSEDAFTNRSFGRAPSVVAADGVFAAGIAVPAYLAPVGDRQISCSDAPTFGRLGVTELSCTQIMDGAISQVRSMESVADVCTDWLATYEIGKLVSEWGPSAGGLFTPPDGYAYAEMAIEICAATCCAAGVPSNSCTGCGRSNTAITVAAAAGGAVVLILAISATFLFKRARSKVPAKAVASGVGIQSATVAEA